MPTHTDVMPAHDAPRLHIVCIGAGYVGGPTMAVIAQQCPHVRVSVFDIAQSRIDAWNSPQPRSPAERGGLPIFEPGLDSIIYAVRDVNLFFTSDRRVLADADIVFIAVNTPTKDYGIGAGRAADMTYVESSARMIAQLCTKPRVLVVEKSTVPVCCNEVLRRILNSNAPPPPHAAATAATDDGHADAAAAASGTTATSFAILSNPEFLAEGTAVRDLLQPDRVLIGGDDADAVATLSSIYAHWVPRERIVTTNLWSSELSKLIANAFLAQRISSINAVSALCERTGADVAEVRDVICRDHRIGAHFLNPSVGFGGSCFQKDILNLVYLCESVGLRECAAYWQQVIAMNDYQKQRFYEQVVAACFNTVRGKTMAVYGFAFKKDTGDTRETPASHVCCRLLQEGARINVYDPKVSAESVYAELEYFITVNRIALSLPGLLPANGIPCVSSPTSMTTTTTSGSSTAGVDTTVLDPLAAYLRTRVRVVPTALQAAQDAAAVLVLTEWNEFRTMDYAPVYACMQKPANLFDGRLIVDADALTRIGFRVFVIGKPTADRAAEMRAASSLLRPPVRSVDDSGSSGSSHDASEKHNNTTYNDTSNQANSHASNGKHDTTTTTTSRLVEADAAV